MGEVQVRSRGPGSAMIKFKNFYRIYDHRVKNIKVTNDFGRPPIIIMGGSSMFPNWTAESFQDFILTYSHSAMDDLLKKPPKHWHTAFMCLTVVCRHYLKADAAVYAKPDAMQMRLEDFELLYNDMVTSMRRDRGSKSTTAKKAHAALGAVGGAVSKARLQVEFCEEGVDVHAHTVALFKTYVEEFGPDGLEMTYYGRMEALKPDKESYTVYCSRAYNRLPKGNAWVLTAQRWENLGAGLVPVDFYIRQTTEQRKDLAFMPTCSAEAENQDMFQEILQVEVSYFVVAERHRKDNALAAPPVVFAVGDAHRGSRVPSTPINTGLWEGPINTVFQHDFVFPPSIVHGRLVTYT
eukprot:jgi/Tetstr1/428147/TSEL_018199.t1